MQINTINHQTNFGILQLDKQAEYCFDNDVVADLKNVKSFSDFFEKIEFAQKSDIDFFVKTDEEHTFNAAAIDMKTGKLYGWKSDTSVHHVINDLIDLVKEKLKK